MPLISFSVVSRVDHRLYDSPEADAGLRGSLPEPMLTQATRLLASNFTSRDFPQFRHSSVVSKEIWHSLGYAGSSNFS